MLSAKRTPLARVRLCHNLGMTTDTALTPDSPRVIETTFRLADGTQVDVRDSGAGAVEISIGQPVETGIEAVCTFTASSEEAASLASILTRTTWAMSDAGAR